MYLRWEWGKHSNGIPMEYRWKADWNTIMESMLAICMQSSYRLCATKTQFLFKLKILIRFFITMNGNSPIPSIVIIKKMSRK